MTDTPDPGPDLGAWLKRHSDGDALTLDYADVVDIHQAMQRLRQSADRLRKQNRSVRRRMQRLKSGEPDDD